MLFTSVVPYSVPFCIPPLQRAQEHMSRYSCAPDVPARMKANVFIYMCPISFQGKYTIYVQALVIYKMGGERGEWEWEYLRVVYICIMYDLSNGIHTTQPYSVPPHRSWMV